jgi:hypothetical protein
MSTVGMIMMTMRIPIMATIMVTRMTRHMTMNTARIAITPHIKARVMAITITLTMM